MWRGLPGTIRVGTFDVEMRVVEHVTDDLTAHGQYTHDDLLIELKYEQRDGAWVVDTVMHEIGHAIWYGSLLCKEDNDERIVGTMARGYTQVLRDNPMLMTWIKGRLK